MSSNYHEGAERLEKIEKALRSGPVHFDYRAWCARLADEIAAALRAPALPVRTCPACGGSGVIRQGPVDGLCQRCAGTGVEIHRHVEASLASAEVPFAGATELLVSKGGSITGALPCGHAASWIDSDGGSSYCTKCWNAEPAPAPAREPEASKKRDLDGVELCWRSGCDAPSMVSVNERDWCDSHRPTSLKPPEPAEGLDGAGVAAWRGDQQARIRAGEAKAQRATVQEIGAAALTAARAERGSSSELAERYEELVRAIEAAWPPLLPWHEECMTLADAAHALRRALVRLRPTV